MHVVFCVFHVFFLRQKRYASEFRYRNPVLSKGDVVLVTSQSGETADTLAAVRQAHENGVLALGVVNMVGSTIARETDAGVYLHAGPEIGVASTKAFTAQVMVLAMIALKLGRERGALDEEAFLAHLEALAAIPKQIEALVADAADDMVTACKVFRYAQNFLFLGASLSLSLSLSLSVSHHAIS